jgi:ABC-type transport system involved in cytochrome c biogenesis permease subunit
MRSPVGNTFETITLIACACVLVSLVMELFNKRGIILIAGVVLGGLACQLGILYESVQATDHMDPLVAVLRSNFLLSTHVITIVLGYAAGLLAAVISHFAVFCQPLNLVRKPTVMALTRMAYGALAFSLLFTLVGTVFGGIWGNEAWGRFWGWDPKENGALMIVLWQLIVLHARRAGYIHVFGLHMGNIVGAIIIAFAWWGVNTMGVGLHSYGFAEGRSALSFFYIAELLVLIAATVLHFRWRAKNQA